jgi:hypothetical protein
MIRELKARKSPSDNCSIVVRLLQFYIGSFQFEAVKVKLLEIF